MRRTWEPGPNPGPTRRDRQGCNFDAYLPDPLVGRPILLDGDVAADVADAEAAVARLNADAVALVHSEALARLLLRAEAVASSRIEGLEVGARRLLRAEAARALGEKPSDVTAEEVLGNIDSMRWAVEAVGSGEEVTVSHLLELNRRLLAGTRLEGKGGRVREEQNWIGGSSFNPCSAVFVPPPPEHVAGLLDDLCRFCNQDSLPTVAQAALAHAQFETIHPFVDGNGRAGRALIHMILRRRGLAPRVLPPVSLILATWATDYVAGLTATRYAGEASSQTAHQGMNRWVAFFAGACRRAVDDAASYERQARELEDGWRTRAGRIRRGSALDLLLAALPSAPVLTVASASSLIGRSFQATNGAVARLAEVGVLKQIRIGRRNRAFEASELVDAFTDLERRLASPSGDTLVARPARPAPRRRPS